MKNQKSLQGAASLKCLFAAFLLVGVSAVTQVKAQPAIIPPTHADSMITNLGSAGYPNSYTIDYSPFCVSAACAVTNHQLTALVADDGAAPTLYVNDQVHPIPLPWTNIAIPAPGGCMPDVVIGNDLANPGLYIAGVVGINAGDVFLYLYHVVGVGTGGLALVGPYSTTNISMSTRAVGPAHIDAIAEYSTLYGGPNPPLPRVNTFAITWKDNAIGIMGYSATLNAPAGGAMIVIDASSTHLSSPDVAAVERTGMTHWGLFSYVDLSVTPNRLYYREWKITAPMALGPVTLYDNAHVYANPNPAASVQRIDAIDDFAQNVPGGPNAYFNIVASAPSPGNSIWEYNNKTGPLVATNITAPVILPAPGLTNQTSTIPVVACGPGRFYTDGYYSVLPPTGGFQNYFATTIDWATGLPTTDPNAYQISQTPYDPAFTPGLALSGTSNTELPGVQDLFAGWDNYNILFYKYSITAAPLGFRQSTTNGVASVVTANSEWQLYPNPGSDQVTLAAPVGFTTNDNARYNIEDLSGKTLLENTISDTNQEINISNLPAGMYLMNIHSNQTNTKTIKFVKE